MAMHRQEVFKHLLISFFSIVLIFTSLFGLTAFFAIDYASELIKELFSGVSVYSSRLFFIQFVLLGLSGLFLHWTAILALSARKKGFTLWSCFISSMILLALNCLGLVQNGFKWIGYEFFHGQPIADNRIFQLAGFALFIISFALTALTGSMIFKKGDANETKL